jgi:hypothetical protein
LLRPDRFAQVTSADATPWPGPEATDATAAETTSGAASPRAQQEDRGLEGFVGPRGEGSRWRVSLNPRFEPLLGISRGYISTPGRSESSPRFRPGALVQTINIMQGQGGSAEGVPNAVQVRSVCHLDHIGCMCVCILVSLKDISRRLAVRRALPI